MVFLLSLTEEAFLMKQDQFNKQNPNTQKPNANLGGGKIDKDKQRPQQGTPTAGAGQRTGTTGTGWGGGTTANTGRQGNIGGNLQDKDKQR